MSKKLLVTILVVLGFLLFKGSAVPVYADEALIPTFGTGKVMVRIYTDYFCGPCANAEPKIEPIISELVRKNVITLTFVDTPIHPPTSLYARYFLFILNEKNEFDHALRVRALLFKAAKSNIVDKEKLEEYLKKNNVQCKLMDLKPTLAVLNGYLQELQANGGVSTPSCMINDGGKRSVYRGGANIVKALELLR